MRHAHPEKSFNVSRWALEHDALTRFLMIVLMLLGVAAYFQLGQDEDPPFTFRAMVVRTYWPGATAQQVPRFTPWDRTRLRFGLRLVDNFRRYGPAAPTAAQPHQAR